MQTLYVIGSINMDLVAQVERFPQPGETLTGTSFVTTPGGKGANQAVMLARLGADVAMVGGVGYDAFGDAYLASLQREGIDTSLIGRFDAPTGVAMIEVDASGENHIVVVPGANRCITPAFLEATLPEAAFSSTVLMQLEIPMESVLYAARRIADAGGRLVLDPAPMQEMPDELLHLAYVVTPNEHELAALTPAATDPFAERMQALRARGARRILHKRGASGAFLLDEEAFLHIPPVQVDAVDTTGAGDAFNAALAYALARGLPLPRSAEIAGYVGAQSTTKVGAQGLESLSFESIHTQDIPSAKPLQPS